MLFKVFPFIIPFPYRGLPLISRGDKSANCTIRLPLLGRGLGRGQMRKLKTQFNDIMVTIKV
jgi:hypothetical protein